MDNLEEKFLEELAKAQARLEGKEPYDDEAIEKEFNPNAEVEKPAPAPKKKPAPKTKAIEKNVKKEESVTPSAQKPSPVKSEKKTSKKPVNKEKLAVIYGAAAVVLSFVLSCLGLLIETASPVWNAFEAYMPFIGIVCGAAAVIWGSLLIKDNKKGTMPLTLGLLAIFISVFVSAINF